MSVGRRFDRDLPGLLTDLAAPSMPSYRDDIVRRTARTRQRPAWIFPERWIPMDTTLRRMPVAPINWRLLALVALLVLAAVAIAIIASGSNRNLPAPPYGPAANGIMVYELGGDIYLADPVSGKSRPIATGPEKDSDPRFSPDGEHIVWIRTTTDGDHGVFAEADGTNVHDLIGPPCRSCTGWGWLGDSRTLYATSRERGRDLALYDTVTAATTEIDIPGEVRMVGFRPPDNRQIAYVTGSPGEGFTLYSMNRDGTGSTPLVSAAELEAFEYSPDGSQIAYEARITSNSAWTVRMIGSDGTGDGPLEHPANLKHQGWPVWSPDGQFLAVWREYAGRNSMLSIIRPDGALVRDYPSIPYPGDYRFSPDGTSIVYFIDPGAVGLSECPLRNSTACPAMVLDVAGDAISTLSFAPQHVWWQREGR